jgi:tetratricopeptide (TPR) repeat protein
LDEVKRRARELELDLCGETSDPLHIEREIELPIVGFGHFDLTPVPEAYFGIRDQATTRSDLGRGHADYLRGLAYELLGRMENAVQSFERAVRQTSDDGEMNLALGRALCMLEQESRAVVFLERAAEALEEHAEAHNALGSALHKLGEVTRARECFQRAVRLAPDEVIYLVNLGRACSELKHFGEARTALEHALRIEPSAADAHAALAVVCHRTGQRQQALHHAKQALADRPDDDTVKELLQLIDEEPT